MDISDWRVPQGHRLIQIGLSLFLGALLVGLAVPTFAVPRLALSVHLLGIMQGLFLSVIGLLWTRLGLTRAMSRAAFSLAVYGCLAAWASNLLAAVWGAGSTMVPIAAGSAKGSAIQEGVIAIGLMTAAVSLVAAVGLVLWGLRLTPRSPSVSES